MVPEEKRDDTLRVGFVNYKVDENLQKYRETFDIVCTEKTSFKALKKTLKFNQKID